MSNLLLHSRPSGHCEILWVFLDGIAGGSRARRLFPCRLLKRGVKAASWQKFPEGWNSSKICYLLIIMIIFAYDFYVFEENFNLCSVGNVVFVFS